MQTVYGACAWSYVYTHVYTHVAYTHVYAHVYAHDAWFADVIVEGLELLPEIFDRVLP